MRAFIALSPMAKLPYLHDEILSIHRTGKMFFS